MAEFVNLTPHEVTVYDSAGQNVVLKIPPSGKVARVTTASKIVGYLNGIPVRRTEYGEIQGLPEPREGVIYIVSTIVLIALREKGMKRDDVIAPDTNPDSIIRDKDGRVIGVKYFQTL